MAATGRGHSAWNQYGVAGNPSRAAAPAYPALELFAVAGSRCFDVEDGFDIAWLKDPAGGSIPSERQLGQTQLWAVLGSNQ